MHAQSGRRAEGNSVITAALSLMLIGAAIGIAIGILDKQDKARHR